MKLQKGFGMIAAIVVLVALSSTQSLVLSQDVLSARAMQTARAGTEWGLYQAFSNAAAWGGASCNAGGPVSATLDIKAITGFQATVTCRSSAYNEGETAPNISNVIRIYRIESVACPAAPCPQTGPGAAATSYIERRREVIGI
jgi:MSHA biogenesis protein MshP